MTLMFRAPNGPRFSSARRTPSPLRCQSWLFCIAFEVKFKHFSEGGQGHSFLKALIKPGNPWFPSSAPSASGACSGRLRALPGENLQVKPI